MKQITVTRVLTEAEAEALNSTPLTIVASPGAGKIFVPESIFIAKLTGNAASSGTGDMQFVYTGDTEVIMSAFDVDATAGVLGDNADRFVVINAAQTSATAETSFPVVETALAANKGFDVKASAALVLATGTTIQVTVTGHVVELRG